MIVFYVPILGQYKVVVAISILYYLRFQVCFIVFLQTNLGMTSGASPLLIGVTTAKVGLTY
ncbi:MAG: hypothetical protein JNM36_15385 [Chitinophagales bacterium]|jgi:hypothetical protein|nr:hypothetical protein [Chitinophagales bacterium]